MIIQDMEISSLIPYGKNPRKISDEAVDKVAASIEKFGFQQPIVVDTDRVVIVGHTRLKAARKLGLKIVPVVIAENLTAEQANAYRLADNKTGEFSKWDDDLLLEELDSILKIDMSEFGFEFEDEEPEAEEDDYDGSVPMESTIKQGDVFLLGEHRLMCGDSTNEEQVARLVNNDTIDLVFTDPPYDADLGKTNKGNYPDDTIDTAKAAYKLFKEYSDSMIIWGGNHFINFLPFSDGWLIWDKRCDSGKTSNKGEMAWCSFHCPVKIYHQAWAEHDKRLHPTQKPIKMLSAIIQDFTSGSDSVLDVFGGSGSTLIACEQLGRKCYTMELDPNYCQVIIDRWENLTGKKAEKIS